MAPAQYVASTFYKTFKHGPKTMTLAMVTQTTRWKRLPRFPAPHVRREFARIAEEVDDYDSRTVKVAMKEGEHKNDADHDIHFTMYEIDAQEQVVRSRHVYDKK